jgi:transposase
MILGRVILAPPERRERKRRARSRSLAVESVRRAKVILMLAAGDSYSEICEQLGCSDRYISLWKERFVGFAFTVEPSTAGGLGRLRRAFWR